MFIEIAPNLIALAVIYATLLIPINIVTEATLSFLGLGVLPPTASWGNMIAEAQTGDLFTVAWWFLVFPCVALVLTTLAFNLLGDGLRDALDPRHGRSNITPTKRVKRTARSARPEKGDSGGKRA
jgi:ABC-type dipeptide/oligopeptide/nickel transport system permease subunit